MSSNNTTVIPKVLSEVESYFKMSSNNSTVIQTVLSEVERYFKMSSNNKTVIPTVLSEVERFFQMSSNNETVIPTVIPKVESPSQEVLILKAIQRTYLWVYTGVGIPANILVILVALSMYKMTSGKFLLAAMAFFDMGATVLKLVFQQLAFNNISNAVVCKMNFMVLFFGMMSNWTLILFCAERSIAACSARKNSSNPMGLPRCVFAVFATAGGLLSFLLPFYFIVNDYSSQYQYCETLEKYNDIIMYLYWAEESLVVSIPYAVLIFLAIILALVGCLSQRHRPGYHSIDDPDSEKAEKVEHNDERLERSLSVIAFSSAVFVFLFTLPSFIFFVTAVNNLFLGILMMQVKFYLYDATNVLKFFIYLIVSDVFRKFFCKVCCGTKVNLMEFEKLTVE